MPFEFGYNAGAPKIDVFIKRIEAAQPDAAARRVMRDLLHSCFGTGVVTRGYVDGDAPITAWIYRWCAEDGVQKSVVDSGMPAQQRPLAYALARFAYDKGLDSPGAQALPEPIVKLRTMLKKKLCA